jgi:dolichol kinase
MIRLPINVVGPLVVVEYSLQSAGYEGLLYPSSSLVPTSFQWLTEFLLQEEAEFPRYYGLFYWAAILVVTSVPTFYLLSLPEGRRLPVVVTRKWFHMIAVLLFGPVIWKMPQLMALAFAIALCVLMVMETIRRDVPAFQHFYVTFLDTAKDSDDQIIVSHMFLIFGCAAPLDDSSAESKSSLLLAEFGILCIGIGDAMGAVVGKWLGRRKWGAGNARTLEGSLAMWLSMMLTGSMVCKTTRELLALAISTTFVTLVEAVTVHLDNLVLPLAGSTIVLLLL